MSFARLNVTKLHRVEGAIVKVNMAKDHFGKPAKKIYQNYKSRNIHRPFVR